MLPGKWMFSSYKDDEMIWYYIFQKCNMLGVYEVVFEIQLPLEIDTFRFGEDGEIIRGVIDDLIKILPQHLQNICDAHNTGINPRAYINYESPYITYRDNAVFICISSSKNSEIQIGGGHIDKSGPKFASYFVLSLKGCWKDTHFSRCGLQEEDIWQE